LLLLGRGSDHFLKTFAADNPALAARVSAAGELPPSAVAAHLRACDLLLQPYPDGISARRGSVMAGLANGVPVVTNLGHLSEPLWAASRCVGLANGPEPAAIAAAAAPLLGDPRRRDELGTAGQRVYRANFSVEQVVARLRAPTPP
jgi:glycosyltransferase involved in cell wall biosynthesis